MSSTPKRQKLDHRWDKILNLMIGLDHVMYHTSSFLHPIYLFRLCSVSPIFKHKFTGKNYNTVFISALESSFTPFLRITWGDHRKATQFSVSPRCLYRSVWFSMIDKFVGLRFAKVPGVYLAQSLARSAIKSDDITDNRSPWSGLYTCPICTTDAGLVLTLDGAPLDMHDIITTRLFGQFVSRCESCNLTVHKRFIEPLECEDTHCADDEQEDNEILRKCHTCEDVICGSCADKQCGKFCCNFDISGLCSTCHMLEYCEYCSTEMCRNHDVRRFEEDTHAYCADCREKIRQAVDDDDYFDDEQHGRH